MAFASQEHAPILTNRLVWVVSSIKSVPGYEEDNFWYEETYRSDLIRVPPDGKKRVLMSIIEASKFLGQVSGISEPFPDGTAINPETKKIEKHRYGKPLSVIELTEEEREKFEGLSPAQAMKKSQEEELALASKKHTNDNQKVIAVGTGKPQAHSTRRKSVSEVSIPDGDIQRIAE